MAFVKLLITGLPNTGKTTLLKDLEDVLVIARDGKKYPFKQPHVNVPDFENAGELIDIVTESINKYEDKFNKLPNTIAIDSISKILLDIEGVMLQKIKAFPYGQINIEIKEFVDFIEKDLTPSFNVVITSHAMFDEETGYKLVNAGGSWGKKGGILSEVDQAVFIQVKGKQRVIHHKHPKFPCRTVLDSLPDNESLEEFNLQKFIELLQSSIVETQDWELL